MRQLRTTTSYSSIYVVSYHALLFDLLLVDMHCNCTRAGFEIHACTTSSPHIRKKNSFRKLMRKIFVVQCYPQNIVNIKLFPNYGMFCVYYCSTWYHYTIHNDYTWYVHCIQILEYQLATNS